MTRPRAVVDSFPKKSPPLAMTLLTGQTPCLQGLRTQDRGRLALLRVRPLPSSLQGSFLLNQGPSSGRPMGH